MSAPPPHGPGHGGVRHWPRPGTWPVWVVPAILAFVQVVGSLGAQGSGPRDGSPGPPWADGGRGTGHTDLDPLGFGLLLAGPALLLLRRRHPVFTLGAVGAVTALYLLRAYTYGPAPFSLAVALLAAVVAGHRAAAWAGT